MEQHGNETGAEDELHPDKPSMENDDTNAGNTHSSDENLRDAGKHRLRNFGAVLSSSKTGNIVGITTLVVVLVTFIITHCQQQESGEEQSRFNSSFEEKLGSLEDEVQRKADLHVKISNWNYLGSDTLLAQLVVGNIGSRASTFCSVTLEIPQGMRFSSRWFVGSDGTLANSSTSRLRTQKIYECNLAPNPRNPVWRTVTELEFRLIAHQINTRVISIFSHISFNEGVVDDTLVFQPKP